MTDASLAIGRRALLLGAGAVAALAPVRALASRGEPRTIFVPAQTRWADPPPQAPVEASVRTVGDAGLFAWDTGGNGEAVVLLHPATGCHESWVYQQPAFAAAGYRVISYSRRGFLGSDPLPPSGQADEAEDLRLLLDKLGVGRAHIVACAAGGFTAANLVARFPERVRSLVLGSTIAVATSPEMRAMQEAILPPGWQQLPAEFRELGPSYRAGNREGTRRWIELEQRSRHGVPRALGIPRPRLDLAALPPLLCITGDADLYAPPAMMRAFVRTVPGAELAVMAEGGHALFWEQPEGFNRTVLSFLKRSGSASPAR